jgi:hypothetical protein
VASREQIQIDIIANTSQAIPSIKGLAGSLAGTINPAELAGQALRKVVEIGKQMIDVWREQELQEAKLAAVLKATGGAAGLSAFELKNMATELEKVTAVGGDTILSAQSILLTFKSIGRDEFPRTLKAAMDLSAAFGQDLKSSVMQVGKALEDPITGLASLRRVGVSFTEDQKELIAGLVEAGKSAEAQGVILDVLEGQVGGVAEAMGDTGAGAAKKLSNAIGDLQEQIGFLLDKAVKPATEALAAYVSELAAYYGLAKQITELKDIFKGMGQNMDDLAKVRGDLAAVNSEIEKINGMGQVGQRLNKTYLDTLIESKRILDFQVKKLEEKLSYEEKLMLAAKKGREDAQKQMDAERKAAKKVSDETAEAYAKTNAGKKEALELEIQTFELYKSWNKGSERMVKIYDEILAGKKADLAALTETKKIEEEILEIKEGQVSINQYNADMFVEANNKAAEEQRRQIFGIEEIKEEVHENQMERINEEREAALDIFNTTLDGMNAISDLINNIGDIKAEQWEAEGMAEKDIEEKKRGYVIAAAQLAKKASIASIIMKTAEAIVAALAIAPPLGPILAGVNAAAGAVQLGVVMSTPIPAAAMGADFTTNGPQLLMVGDNAGGRERVSVTPIGTPGGGGGNITINVQGSVVTERQLARIITGHQAQMLGDY